MRIAVWSTFNEVRGQGPATLVGHLEVTPAGVLPEPAGPEEANAYYLQSLIDDLPPHALANPEAVLADLRQMGRGGALRAEVVPDAGPPEGFRREDTPERHVAPPPPPEPVPSSTPARHAALTRDEAERLLKEAME